VIITVFLHSNKHLSVISEL